MELHQIQPQNDDEKWMLEALKEAQKAFKKDEVPIGAVVVKEGRVIARGHNQVEMLRDATAHAEMLAITAAANSVENWRLEGAKLYCTLEPCSMCFGAMVLSRVEELVYGAPDLRHGACGSWVDLAAEPHPIHQLKVRGGVLEEPARWMIQSFFKKKRVEKSL